MHFWREKFKHIFFIYISLLFLQISQLCNASTHDKVAPTPQNLICDGKSATEIILLSQHNQVSHLTKDELNLTFVQNQADKNGLILILDLSPAMEPHWPVFRSAIQQLFLTLPNSQFLSAIWNGNYFHRSVNDSYWKDYIFRPTFEFDTPLDINQAFVKVQENMGHFVSPKIVILTASDFTQSAEELSTPLNLIKEHLLSVDILTMSNANNSALMPLSVYGQVFAGKINFLRIFEFSRQK